ncbi:MAG: hypothetical protein LBC88_07905, partial [Spirochaetaceae bacterium]|nr:hypothetical protein [Spirochaetaceae bacterium]
GAVEFPEGVGVAEEEGENAVFVSGIAAHDKLSEVSILQREGVVNIASASGGRANSYVLCQEACNKDSHPANL